MKRLCVVLAGLLLAPALIQAADKEKKVGPALKFTMKGNDGKPVDLSKYQGKVVLFVNVASRCGYTKQYTGLQALNEKYGKDGLVIVGVPCNQFGKQEPGSDADIAEFCSSKFKVTFPLLSKTDVNGAGACDLYKFLTSKETDQKFAGPIKWNFTKFLVNKQGEVVGRFEPKVTPAELDKVIAEELKK
jgi:glutathione peroxidase